MASRQAGRTNHLIMTQSMKCAIFVVNQLEKFSPLLKSIHCFCQFQQKGDTATDNKHTKVHSFSQKAKQQTQRVNEQNLKPVSAWVTDGKCLRRSIEGEEKEVDQLRLLFSRALGELVASEFTRHNL
ncbi:CLUMA_CG012533, isoform A [Clunio marinus]|uniref:CLUMA_CG012533, isoform A n=1 Tax=Clunio marinus TaxID=568069 RepID=A0A1J1IG21_9DIPT|nr:CLUMA_CG012533, isoform A [Clunio marinus]